MLASANYDSFLREPLPCNTAESFSSHVSSSPGELFFSQTPLQQLRYDAVQVEILQRGVQWKQGVVICMTLYTSLLHNTTPIHCTPLRLHPPLMNTQLRYDAVQAQRSRSQTARRRVWVSSADFTSPLSLLQVLSAKLWSSPHTDIYIYIYIYMYMS